MNRLIGMIAHVQKEKRLAVRRHDRILAQLRRELAELRKHCQHDNTQLSRSGDALLCQECGFATPLPHEIPHHGENIVGCHAAVSLSLP